MRFLSMDSVQRSVWAESAVREGRFEWRRSSLEDVAQKGLDSKALNIVSIAPIQSQMLKEPYLCDGGSCLNPRNCFRSVQPLFKIADQVLSKCTLDSIAGTAGTDEEPITKIHVDFLDAQTWSCVRSLCYLARARLA